MKEVGHAIAAAVVGMVVCALIAGAALGAIGAVLLAVLF